MISGTVRSPKLYGKDPERQCMWMNVVQKSAPTKGAECITSLAARVSNLSLDDVETISDGDYVLVTGRIRTQVREYGGKQYHNLYIDCDSIVSLGDIGRKSYEIQVREEIASRSKQSKEQRRISVAEGNVARNSIADEFESMEVQLDGDVPQPSEQG